MSPHVKRRVKPTQLYRGDDAPEPTATLPIQAESKDDFKAEMKRRSDYRASARLLEAMAEAGV